MLRFCGLVSVPVPPAEALPGYIEDGQFTLCGIFRHLILHFKLEPADVCLLCVSHNLQVPVCGFNII